MREVLDNATRVSLQYSVPVQHPPGCFANFTFLDPVNKHVFSVLYVPIFLLVYILLGDPF